ncbi:MAG: tyrosine-type recombinase/integrase [Rhodospirillales bacterium]|nr:tyrosine-type recombinase/integrase [Rhodospirillales bacterium]
MTRLAALVRLLMLTGCRLGEINTLKWDYVDLARQCLLLPDSKTGRKTVTLSTAAAELLTQIPRMKDNPHVIPGSRPGPI